MVKEEFLVILLVSIELLKSGTGFVQCFIIVVFVVMLADTTNIGHHGKNAEFQFACRIDVV